MSLSWSHRDTNGRHPCCFRVLRASLHGKTPTQNLLLFETLATAVGLVPKDEGNVIVVDTTALPADQVRLSQLPSCVKTYRKSYAALARYVHTTVLVVNNGLVRSLIDGVMGIMSKTATRVITVATTEEADAAVDRAMKEFLTTASHPDSSSRP